MVIQYFGNDCFRVQSGELSVLVDPSSNRLKGDVILRTHTASDEAVTNPEEIASAGEYEVRGIEIFGKQLETESTAKLVKTVYAVTWEGIKLVFLGRIANPLDAAFIEDLGDPDILFLPTGDSHFLSPDDAAKLVKKFEPAVVIPAYHKKDADDFLKAMGKKETPQEKFVFKKKDLPEKGKAQVVVLKANG